MSALTAGSVCLPCPTRGWERKSPKTRLTGAIDSRTGEVSYLHDRQDVSRAMKKWLASVEMCCERIVGLIRMVVGE
jgi:hypothetical protein